MTEDNLIAYEMDFGDGYQAITREQIARIGPLFRECLEEELKGIGEKMLDVLRDEYNVLIRTRPRDEGESLKDKVMAAMVSRVVASASGQFDLGVFDVAQVEQATSGADMVGPGQRSLFDIMEEGYDSAMPFGFIPLEAAEGQAQKLIETYSLPAEQADKFLAKVREAFHGRHGQGIMTNVFAPLFYDYPDWGTPLEHGFLPHAGWEGWGVLFNFDPDKASGEDDWIASVLRRALQKVGKRLATTG